MSEKILLLNSYRLTTHWIEKFLVVQESRVNSHTWTNYARSLELWRLYLDSYYGETYLGELNWQHFEEFLAWWYFRHYLGTSYEEIQVLLISLENFAQWLKDNGIVYFPLWQEEEGNCLKQDIKRVFTWRKLKALCEEKDDDFFKKRRLARDNGWFMVLQLNSDFVELINLLSQKKYLCQLEGQQLKTFLKEGDIFLGYIWGEREKICFLDDQSLSSLYPRAAQKYLKGGF